MATGVLPLLLGKYTRLAQFFGPLPKTYTGAIPFAFATDTYDADGIPATPLDAPLPSNTQIQSAAARFRGQVEQTPPPFSAKKVEGKLAYKVCAAPWRDRSVEVPAPLLIDEFVIGEIKDGCAEFTIRISSVGVCALRGA